MAKRVSQSDSGTDTLAQLLASEQRLARQLDDARAEAAQIVRDAEDYARGTESMSATMITERLTALASSTEQQLQVDLQRIEADAARDAKRFSDIDAARTRDLVRRVIRAILREDGALVEEPG